MNCLLCSSQSVNHEISFWKCLKCELIFKDPATFPDFKTEKARYETHNNDETDEGYLQYLDKLFRLCDFKKGKALDFGCGPSKGLEALVHSKKLFEIEVDSYDPLFFDHSITDKKYDLIFASECLEHFFNPARDIQKIVESLNEGGTLAVSTEFHDGKKINSWWYARDSTHVAFYSTKTFHNISKIYGLKQIYIKSPHILFEKKVTGL